MDRLVATTEDLISVLDRVLDTGIVFDSWVRVTLHGTQHVSVDAILPSGTPALETAAIYAGYEGTGIWIDLDTSGNLFPYWCRDFWTK